MPSYLFKDHSMESLLTKYSRVAVVVAAYWIISITLVFLNKYLLSDPEHKIDAPLFITFFQCVVSFSLCIFLSSLAKISNFISFPNLGMDLKIIKEVFPASILFVATVSLNNLCLKNVNVSFYYVSRSLTTVFNVIFTYLILKQDTSKNVIFCCTVIIFGYLLGVDQENVIGSFSVKGGIYGVLSSMFLSLYTIYVKRVLPAVDGNIWSLTFYNNLNASILFIPLLFITQEIPIIINFANLNNSVFWGLMILGGIIGFAIGFVTGLQIHITSPLTHNISGTAKACAQTIIAVIYNASHKPFLWWTSNVIVLIGSTAYTNVQRLQMKQIHLELLKNMAQNDIEKVIK